MLYSKDGHTNIEGHVVTVLSDLTAMIKAVKECLEEHYDEEFARDKIAECGKLAFMTDYERHIYMQESIKETAEKHGVDVADVERIVDVIREHIEEMEG